MTSSYHFHKSLISVMKLEDFIIVILLSYCKLTTCISFPFSVWPDPDVSGNALEYRGDCGPDSNIEMCGRQ